MQVTTAAPSAVLAGSEEDGRLPAAEAVVPVYSHSANSRRDRSPMNWGLYTDDAPAVSGVEQEIIENVSTDEPWALVEEFAGLDRISGSDDEREAAEYLTTRLADLGLPHAIYEPELFLSTPGSATVKTDDGWRAESTKTVSFSNDESVEGDLVYARNDDEMESIEAMLSVSLDGLQEDLSGKVILAESIIPISAIEELADRGAEGFIGIHPHEREPHEGIVTPIWGGAPTLSNHDRLPDLAVANVSKQEGKVLIEKAQEGMNVSVTCETMMTWQRCPLVISRIPGEADPETDEFVLLHGHLDSWDVGVTDNATGDAALLEAARVLNAHRDTLRRDVWVAWWPGHSTGRYAGSTWFADEFAHDLVERCLAHVNVDSPGVADATEFDSRVKWMSALDGVARGAITDVSGKETAERRPPRAGDYSFNNLGIPGMSLQSSIPDPIRERRGYHPVGGSGGHSDAWHLSTDSLEKADPEVLIRDIQIYTLATARLSMAVDSPLQPLHTIDRHLNVVSEYDEAGRFDLSPVLVELRALRETTERALQAEPDPMAISRLVQTLVRLNFASEGPFEQDPAESRLPYPSLEPATRLENFEGNTRKFLKLELHRTRNAVVAKLRDMRKCIAPDDGSDDSVPISSEAMD